MKPELNPKSPLNACYLVTVHFGGWMHKRYCGNNFNEAESIFIGLSKGFGLSYAAEKKSGVVRPVVKFWTCTNTIKVGFK